MKKKLIAMLLAVTLGAFLLTACGGSDAKAEKKEEPAKESVEAVEEADDAEEVEETEEVAEEAAEEEEISFEDLKELYAGLVDNYNAIEELYLNENIQQDDAVEEVLARAKTIIEEMGEATEADFPDDQSRADMIEAMTEVNQKLSDLLPE